MYTTLAVHLKTYSPTSAAEKMHNGEAVAPVEALVLQQLRMSTKGQLSSIIVSVYYPGNTTKILTGISR